MSETLFAATLDHAEEWIDGGTGATPDEAFCDWLANHCSDDVSNICNKPGEELEVEIWSTREPSENERAEDYHWMLDKKLETRIYVAKAEDFDS